MTIAKAVMASARVKGSTARDDWQTPEHVLMRVRSIGPIGLDPCTTIDNPVGARTYCDGDGLKLHWGHEADGRGLVYCNPPYSQIGAWTDKIVTEAVGGAEIVSLVAARPDSKWFYRLVWDSAQAVCFWKGRLRFVGAPSSAPFPSAVVYHGRRQWAFEAAFHDAGRVVRL
jgi:phage N-6-adenine-methyltransferase